MSSRGDVPVDAHLERAARHRKVGEALIPDEWAAVCFFYSAYHFVRHALRTDDVFTEPTRLSRINAELTPEDAAVSRHHGFRRTPQVGRKWGLNELVIMLYRPVAFDYERLHQASIEVRYHGGLKGIPTEDLLSSLNAIQGAHERGQLRAAANGL